MSRPPSARLDALAPVIEARLAFTRDVIGTRRSAGFAAAAALVATDRGQLLMGDVRRRIAAMQAEEEALLARRTADRAARERATAVVTLAGAVGAFALVALIIWVIRQDVALQQRWEATRPGC